ncbi:hypothetical protein BJ875DRAFT_446597 [Amylocarpus encephaloides]|uniref:Uncharacterized protein n=1 Tax=Amylocarpus encephaloides TaxID=45428 RepID=A0A9P7Y7D1_9HELO|nr:hypothetical protein BJ875DRAFT_446597 [Amylocarpus encephaloides]
MDAGAVGEGESGCTVLSSVYVLGTVPLAAQRVMRFWGGPGSFGDNTPQAIAPVAISTSARPGGSTSRASSDAGAPHGGVPPRPLASCRGRARRRGGSQGSSPRSSVLVACFPAVTRRFWTPTRRDARISSMEGCREKPWAHGICGAVEGYMDLHRGLPTSSLPPRLQEGGKDVPLDRLPSPQGQYMPWDAEAACGNPKLSPRTTDGVWRVTLRAGLAGPEETS